MILISVKSEVVDDKRQFKSDTAAMKYLKNIKRLHESHRIAVCGKKPEKKDFKVGLRRRFSRVLYNKAVNQWQLSMNATLKLKIEIINTKHNQLDLAI